MVKRLVVSRYPKGLLKRKEIEGIIEILKTYQPHINLRYEYHKQSKLEYIMDMGGEVLFLTPFSDFIEVGKSKVQAALDSFFPHKYLVTID